MPFGVLRYGKNGFYLGGRLDESRGNGCALQEKENGIALIATQLYLIVVIVVIVQSVPVKEKRPKHAEIRVMHLKNAVKAWFVAIQVMIHTSVSNRLKKCSSARGLGLGLLSQAFLWKTGKTEDEMWFVCIVQALGTAHLNQHRTLSNYSFNPLNRYPSQRRPHCVKCCKAFFIPCGIHQVVLVADPYRLLYLLYIWRSEK